MALTMVSSFRATAPGGLHDDARDLEAREPAHEPPNAGGASPDTLDGSTRVCRPVEVVLRDVDADIGHGTLP